MLIENISKHSRCNEVLLHQVYTNTLSQGFSKMIVKLVPKKGLLVDFLPPMYKAY